MAKIANMPEAAIALKRQDQTFCCWAGPQLLRNAGRNTRRPRPFLFSVVPLTAGTHCDQHPEEEVWVQVPPTPASSSAQLVWVLPVAGGIVEAENPRNIWFPGSAAFPSVSSLDPRLLICKMRRVASKSVSFFLKS